MATTVIMFSHLELSLSFETELVHEFTRGTVYSQYTIIIMI